MLAVATAEAALGAAEGGIPIGAALFTRDGVLLGSGRNRRVQDGDASMHGETNAFRNAGRQTNYRDTVMVTTLSPCWYCSGLIRQFGIGRIVVGDDQNFLGGQHWAAEHGAELTVVNDAGLIAMMGAFIAESPGLWNEDIGAV
ncbi:tRNA-specific adenosine deaminase [Subtercola boreus]|uniref:tRNA-specific adenosine deaminase n=2 Tax=Subtercola boreus TaxID=120213 RepID=A0A3E0VYP4_9MICO|nr:tRNA-specific adenosine deaminase [Subtercola boreus]